MDRKPSCGFSLVELLVVIAIISVLAAMLLPTLAKAVGSARKISCLNNLGQVGLATQMYAHDSNGWTYCGDTLFQYWMTIPRSGMYGKMVETGHLPGATVIDARTVPVLYCPQLISGTARKYGFRAEYNGGYHTSYYRLGGPNVLIRNADRTAAIPRPMEPETYTTFHPTTPAKLPHSRFTLWGDFLGGTHYFTSTSGYILSGWHDGMVSVGVADGHAACLNPETIRADGNGAAGSYGVLNFSRIFEN